MMRKDFKTFRSYVLTFKAVSIIGFALLIMHQSALAQPPKKSNDCSCCPQMNTSKITESLDIPPLIPEEKARLLSSQSVRNSYKNLTKSWYSLHLMAAQCNKTNYDALLFGFDQTYKSLELTLKSLQVPFPLTPERQEEAKDLQILVPEVSKSRTLIPKYPEPCTPYCACCNPKTMDETIKALQEQRNHALEQYRKARETLKRLQQKTYQSPEEERRIIWPVKKEMETWLHKANAAIEQREKLAACHKMLNATGGCTKDIVKSENPIDTKRDLDRTETLKLIKEKCKYFNETKQKIKAEIDRYFKDKEREELLAAIDEHYWLLIDGTTRDSAQKDLDKICEDAMFDMFFESFIMKYIDNKRLEGRSAKEPHH